MSAFESIILLVVEFVCGAAGGLALGRWAGSRNLGRLIDGLAGGIGGLLLTWLAARIPGVGRYVGYVENAADAAMRGMGGLTPAILVGVGVAGLLGGVLLTAFAGFLRSRTPQ
jgi:hypothetical protein